MKRVSYEIRFCWNGSKRQVAFADRFESKREWKEAIWSMPYDILDETNTVCFVDYGDNDDWSD